MFLEDRAGSLEILRVASHFRRIQLGMKAGRWEWQWEQSTGQRMAMRRKVELKEPMKKGWMMKEPKKGWMRMVSMRELKRMVSMRMVSMSSEQQWV